MKAWSTPSRLPRIADHVGWSGPGAASPIAGARSSCSPAPSSRDWRPGWTLPNRRPDTHSDTWSDSRPRWTPWLGLLDGASGHQGGRPPRPTAWPATVVPQPYGGPRRSPLCGGRATRRDQGSGGRPTTPPARRQWCQRRRLELEHCCPGGGDDLGAAVDDAQLEGAGVGRVPARSTSPARCRVRMSLGVCMGSSAAKSTSSRWLGRAPPCERPQREASTAYWAEVSPGARHVQGGR